MNRILDYEDLSNKIQSWIKLYVEENNIKSLVVGVSGGIDSAVVSTLCAKTGIPTFALGIKINSNEENTKLSRLQLSFLEKLGVKKFEYEFSDVFTILKERLEFNFPSELGFANTKSRLRMITLYQAAASVGGIVVGTGNKVEDFGVGFYTKYGDGGVDISPIAELYKTEVRELGRFLGVPEEIINAEPTDGLWEDNRKDENQIGASYEDLEWVMEIGLDKWRTKPTTDKEKRVVKTYLEFNHKNKHKMESIPVFNLKDNNII
jgi:NAD+ synthase